MAYWYWRGIAQGLPTVAAVEEFLAGAPRPLDEIFPTVDLEPRIEQAEQWMDRERPNAVRILYGENVIGLIYPQPGAERLRGIHLRAALAKESWWPLVHVLIAEKAAGTEILWPRLASTKRDTELPSPPFEPEPKFAPFVSTIPSEESLA
jgi:hypothetical protein